MGLPRRVLEETAIEEISSTFGITTVGRKRTQFPGLHYRRKNFSFGQFLLIEHNQQAQESLEAAI